MAIAAPLSGFTQQNIDRAPEEAGVYGLYDRHQAIYHGRAQGGDVTIRSRLIEHNAGHEGVCTQRATHFNYEITPAPAAREERLLHEHQALYGRLPRCNERIG